MSDMDDFSFYLKLAKPLLLNLPYATDRSMAALWLKKLSDVNSRVSDPESDNIHVEYLKLLLMVMQGKHLTGIFEKPPPEGSLHDLLNSGQRKATEMISLVKDPKTSGNETQNIPNSFPRVVTSIGGDMCEYVAVQEIPNFGVHGYYALSTEPLPKWWNPQSSESPSATNETNVRDSIEDIERSREAKETMDSDDTIVIERGKAGPSEFSRKNHEKTRHSEKSLQKIFQAQRSEIAGVETRPCWGRSRYIERLIDESPHLVGDLDLSEADALLHLYRDRKLMKVKSGRSGAKETACAISSRRRQVEARLDMPPCASVPVEENVQKAGDQESRTCLPRKIESDCMYEVRRGNYERCCLSENEEYYPTDPIESVGSISLRGGSDDTGLVSRAGGCPGRRTNRDSFRKNQPAPNMKLRNQCGMYSSQRKGHEGIDVDREIAEATALASGKVRFNATREGNFSWVKKEMCPFLNDARKKTSKNCGINTGCSQSRGCNRRAAVNYGQPSSRWASESEAEPSHAMSHKTILRSKAASPDRPGVNEKARYWKEILDLEDTIENPSMPEGSDTSSCCGCRDRQHGSEIEMETPAQNWRDFAYESEGDEIDEDLEIAEAERSRTSRAMISNDSNELRDEVHRLVEDPRRKAPPSRGKVKSPRHNHPRLPDQGDENWNPPGHSTPMGH